MALKPFLFVSLLLVIVLTAPLAAEALLGSILGLLRININGTVLCSTNGTVAVNGTATPVFPGAAVQLQCSGNMVASATTNSSGVFSIVLNPLQVVLSSLLQSCRLVVTTPLATCNASLPALGSLTSNLQRVGDTTSGLRTIMNLLPTGFLLE